MPLDLPKKVTISISIKKRIKRGGDEVITEK